MKTPRAVSRGTVLSGTVLSGTVLSATLLAALLIAGMALMPALVSAQPLERYKGLTLADVLRVLQSKGLRIVFSSETVTPAMRVASEPRGRSDRNRLDAAMFWFGRARKRDCNFRALLLLSYIGVLSHVSMDLLNNYGVRLLMPLSGRWFYGDAAFIIDFWLWLTLGAGVWLALSRGRATYAHVALVVSAAYIGALVVSARASRELVLDQWRLQHGNGPRALMVGPMPLTPFSRAVIVDSGEAYATGTFSWFSRAATFDRTVVPKNDQHPAVRTAVAGDPRFRAVLIWARFPYYNVEATAQGDVVTLRDLRFGGRVGGVNTLVRRSTEP